MSNSQFTFLNKTVIFLIAGVLVMGCSKKNVKFSIFPYSMVEYKPGHFIDDSEITVEQWAEFVVDGHENRKPDSLVAKKYKYYQLFYPSQTPDSLYHAYGKISYYELPVIKEYFDTLNYTELRQILDFPISGITFEDVQDYCAWRTKRYNEVNTTFTKQQIEFVLPDKVIVDPLENLFVENKNGRNIPIANYLESTYIRIGDAPHQFVTKQVGKQPVKTKTFPLNKNGVYDLWGNVAEMTNTKGDAYGGSYQTSPEEFYHIPYQKAEDWLGFRCVGIVKK